MIENILFPVDFSPSCAAMASYVRRAADLYGSRVTLLHVCDLTSHNGFELYVRTLEEVAEEHLSIARDKLDSFLKSEFPSVTYPRMLRSGEAAAQIAEVAKTAGFDLIVMPTHAGRFRKMLLGSTTAKVLNDADCPVLTTEHAEITNPRPLEHRQWICAISLSPDSERVLRLASRAAAGAGAELSVIHAIQNSSFDEKEARRRMGELLASVDCEGTVSISAGPIKEVLLEEAHRSAADVVIIGRSLGSSVIGRMRELTYGVVRDSTCPVLSV